MASSGEKELEDRLLEAGNRLASPLSAVEELLALLDQTESFLSRVDQSPSQSMSAALRPAMKALVAKELLEHSELDVKVAVASCVSEITRITAPDAPYDDDLMKVIFQMIVEAFGKLDDMSSRSYSKRVSILETVAKVRSCVVMLDLECDALIVEMFRHFLKTIRSNHPENVFSSMEMIMTLVLEESEDISTELLACLLDSVKKEKEVLPIARRLGEKVIGNCAVKLKPYLMEVQSLCAPSEYSKIVASICQANSDALEQNEINVSGEVLADDSKLSERTVSDELPQGSAKQDQEEGSPEKVGTADKSPRSVMSNGVVQRGNGDSMAEPTSPKQKPERSRRSGQSKSNVAADRADSDNLESVDVKSDSTLDLKTKKTRGRKANSSNQVADTTDYSRNDSDKEAPSVPSRRKGRSKEADSLQFDGLSGKEAESAVSLEPEEKNDLQPPHRSDNGTVSISSPTPSESVPEASRPKRGRPPGSKVSAKRGVNAVADPPASPSGEKGALGNSQTQDESLPSEDNDFKKEPEAVGNSEGKSHRRSGKKGNSENADDGETLASVTSDSEAKPVGLTGKRGSKKKVMEGESSGKQQKSNIKQLKGKATLEKDAAEEPSLKDVPSSPKSGTKLQTKDQSHLEDTGKTQSRRKRARGAEEVSETPDHKTKLDQNLVGSGIQVWWPDDKRFYKGTVEAFEPDSGKHKIIYDDGDVEVLFLKDERFKLGEGGSETEGGQAKDLPSPNVSPDMPRKKKAKTNSESVPKQGKAETPLKSGVESSGKHDSQVTKRKGRPKGGASTKLGNLSNDSTKTPRKSKEKAARKSKDDTPNPSSKLKRSRNKSKDGTSKLGGKSEDDASETSTKDDNPRSGGKPKDVTPKSGRKSKDGTPKTSSKDDTPRIGSKLMDESMEDTQKTESKSRDDAVSTGKSGNRKIKSKEGTPKAGRKPKPKGSGSVTPKTGNESNADGASEKGKAKVLESETPMKAQENEATTGKKRKRKGHK